MKMEAWTKLPDGSVTLHLTKDEAEAIKASLEVDPIVTGDPESKTLAYWQELWNDLWTRLDKIGVDSLYRSPADGVMKPRNE